MTWNWFFFLTTERGWANWCLSLFRISSFLFNAVENLHYVGLVAASHHIRTKILESVYSCKNVALEWVDASVLDAGEDKSYTPQAYSTLNSQTETLRFLVHSYAAGLKCSLPWVSKHCEVLEIDFTCRELVHTERHRIFLDICLHLPQWSTTQGHRTTCPEGKTSMFMDSVDAQGHINSFCSHLRLPVSPCLPHES